MKATQFIKSAQGMAVVTAAVALFTVIFSIPVPAQAAAQPTQYTKPGTIYSEIESGYTVLDETGELWAFDGDGFIVGQDVEMTFSDAGTSDYIYDDELVDVNPIASPYSPDMIGPFGRYILRASIKGAYENHSEFWLVDEFGDDWFFHGFCPAELNENVTLIVNAAGTPNDFSDDFIEDILWCNCAED